MQLTQSLHTHAQSRSSSRQQRSYSPRNVGQHFFPAKIIYQYLRSPHFCCRVCHSI